jgi:co-chaperonin GroES (HSP10)
VSDFEISGEWTNATTEFPPDFYEDLPVPLYWRVIVAPAKPKEETRGGIIIPKANQDVQEILNCMGKVVALGSYAGVDERLGGDGTKPGANFPKVGDTVFYGRHAGAHMLHKKVKLVVINDDEMLTLVPNPDTIATSA